MMRSNIGPVDQYNEGTTSNLTWIGKAPNQMLNKHIALS